MHSKLRACVRSARRVVAIALLACTASASYSEEKPSGLFVNLTTDDTWAAAKAITFAHEKVLKRGHRPVAVWLNVRAIYLADNKRRSHFHGLMRDKGQSIQDMLKALVFDGGIVIACAACSRAAGLTADDLIEGVRMGNPDLTKAQVNGTFQNCVHVKGTFRATKGMTTVNPPSQGHRDVRYAYGHRRATARFSSPSWRV